jgi:tetratricopeptide (TPR) repeat protein
MLAVFALVAATGAVGAWLFYQQRATAHARQAQTDLEARAILGPARVRLEDGWKAADLVKLTEAHAEGDRAADVARRGGASPPVRQEAEEFREDAARWLARARKNHALTEALVNLVGPQDTNKYVRDEWGQMRPMTGRGTDEQYSAAFRRWGLDVDGAAEAEVVARLAAQPEPVVQELIGALEMWALLRRHYRPGAEWRRLFRVVDQLDRSNRRRQLRALVLGEPSPGAEAVAGMVGARSPWQALWELRWGVAWRRLRELRREIDPRTESVLTVLLLANLFVVARDAASAEEVLSRASTARPREVLLLHRLGNLLAEQGPPRLEEAIGCFRAARALRPWCGVSLSDALVRAGRPSQAEAVMQELLSQRPDHPGYRAHLGFALMAQRRFGEAEATYRKVIALDPDYAEVHHNLGSALTGQGKYAEAEVAYRRALALRPQLHGTYSNLGVVLLEQGKGREAEEALCRAISFQPDVAYSHRELGRALGFQGKYREAEGACRQAIALRPDYAGAHNYLGAALIGQGRHKEAEQACRDAIKLKPDYADTHNNLGAALLGQGRHKKAEQAFRDAIRLKPDYGDAHYNLGNVLIGQGRHKEAEQAFRDAVRLKPDYAGAHNNLGVALIGQGRHKEAEQACRDAIKLKPDYAKAHNSLGVALSGQGRHKEAEQAFRATVRLKPDYAEAHYNLAVALRDQGIFEEAVKSFRRCAALFPSGSGNCQLAQQQSAETERLIELDARLTEVLAGKGEPVSPPEQIRLASLAQQPHRALYCAALSLYSEAFAARPDREARHRYDAARAAALAGCGQGKDAADSDDAQRARWRRQALQWLRLDLARWGKALDGAKGQARAQVRARMQYWRSDGDFAVLRGNDALARIPAEERKEWQRFWAEVDALIQRASEPD